MDCNESTKKILVVDDNDDNRELVVKVLKKQGYNLCMAIDGEDARDFDDAVYCERQNRWS